VLQVSYQESGGPLIPMSADWVPRRYRVVDPRTGETVETGERLPDEPIPPTGDGPRVVIFSDGSQLHGE
jgi:hypothetical protein